MRDVAVVAEHGAPFLFGDADDSVAKMKAFVSNNDASVLDADGATMIDLMKCMLSYASSPLASKLLLQKRLFRFLQLSPPPPPPSFSSSSSRFLSVKASGILGLLRHNSHLSPLSPSSRSFCSHSSNLLDESQGPTTIDYSSLLQEGEFHRLADSTIHSLQEKLEDYGDVVEVDGFDIDYGNDVLTVKLGELGTYVLNKQTPNRQLWLSSPVSGPSRFDWDQDNNAWIYRRNKANLYKILEAELEQLCGKPIVLS